MNFRFPLLSGMALLVSIAGASAASTPAPSSSGSVPVTTTNVQPSTPAPPQPNAQSAPGAAAPSGSNGTTAGGAPATKAPGPGAAPAGTTGTAGTKPAGSLFDKYIKDLTDTLKLSADEQKEIQTYYLEDGAQLKKILNDNSLSPLQQAQQVSDLRDARNARIEAVLIGTDRLHEFFQLEARYRVALTELAADGGLVPATPVAAE